MSISRTVALWFVLAASTFTGATQAPSQPTNGGPTFDVVSIKRSGEGSRSSINERPDGGLTVINYPLGALITRAYPPAIPLDMIGLPEWTMTDRYDVKTTSTILNPTPDDRRAMLRAMLADRFKLVAHVETRDQPAFDLVVARSDGKLGPRIRASEVECEPPAKPERTATDQDRAHGAPAPMAQLPQTHRSAPVCSVQRAGARMEGEVTMSGLATLLRPAAGRYIQDKTGLTGSYHITLEFDRRPPTSTPDPDQTAPEGLPSVFTAVVEQLGLKLRPSRAKRDTLVIDRVEKLIEN
jgi:uncharacterized protein (TIGR03435 family)